MFTYSDRVRFDDVDHAGIVYYPRFFHFFHVTFEEFFRARCGNDFYRSLLTERRLGFPTVNAQCDYRSPLRFGDEWTVEMSCTELRAKVLPLSYRVLRGQELCAVGKNIAVCVNMDAMKSTPIPEDLSALFSEITVDSSS